MIYTADPAVKFWREQEGKPYFYGAEGLGEWDCSGLYRQGLIRAGVWPMKGDAGVAGIWASDKFIHVEFEDRKAGDAIIYGNTRSGDAFHMTCVLSFSELIGANGGFPPRGFGTTKQEPLDEYRARIKERGSRVRITGPEYWSTARLGVVRPPLFI